MARPFEPSFPGNSPTSTGGSGGNIGINCSSPANSGTNTSTSTTPTFSNGIGSTTGTNKYTVGGGGGGGGGGGKSAHRTRRERREKWAGKVGTASPRGLGSHLVGSSPRGAAFINSGRPSPSPSGQNNKMSSSKHTRSSTPSPMSGNHQRVPFGMPPPSPSTAATGTAGGSAGKAAVQKAAKAGSPSITFHAPSPPRTNQASNFISHQTAGPSSASSTAAAAAAAAASTSGAAGTAAAAAVTAATANNSSYSLRQLLQSLALNPPGTPHDADAPRASPASASSTGSGSSDKENGGFGRGSGGTGTTFGTAASATAAAASARTARSTTTTTATTSGTASPPFPNPRTAPNDGTTETIIERLITELPQALHLRIDSAADTNNGNNSDSGGEQLELDEAFYRDMAEALVRCSLRKRSASSAAIGGSVDGQRKRSELGPARPTAVAARAAEAAAATSTAASMMPMQQSRVQVMDVGMETSDDDDDDDDDDEEEEEEEEGWEKVERTASGERAAGGGQGEKGRKEESNLDPAIPSDEERSPTVSGGKKMSGGGGGGGGGGGDMPAFRDARSAIQSSVGAGAAGGAVHSPIDAAKVDKEAQFLSRLKIDDDSGSSNINTNNNSNKGRVSPEGIVADRVQQLGLGLDGKKDGDATATNANANTNTNTPSAQGGQKKAASVKFNSPTNFSASAAAAANVATTPTTTTTRATTTGKAAAATAAAATPGAANSKFSNLKDKWEGFSSPDPVKTNAAAAGGGGGAAMSTPAAAAPAPAPAPATPSFHTPAQEMEAEAEATQKEEKKDPENDDSNTWDNADPFGDSVDVSVGDVNLSVHADAATAAYCMGKAAVDNANTVETPAGKTDEHGFPSPDPQNYPSPPTDDSFDADQGMESSFFFSPTEAVHEAASESAFIFTSSTSNFGFDPPAPPTTPGKPAADGEAKDKTIKPLKPPHTNAKQGKMRRKIASSATAGVAASVGAAAAATGGSAASVEQQGSAQPAPAPPAAESMPQYFNVDLSKGKVGAPRKQGKSKGQRASMVAPTATATKTPRHGEGATSAASAEGSPMDVDMGGSTPPRHPRPSSAEEAMAAAAARVAAEAAAANIDPSVRNDFAIGSSSPSSQKSPRNRGGRSKGTKLRGKLQAAAAKSGRNPLAASIHRGGTTGSGLNSSFDSTASGPPKFPPVDPFAPTPAPAAPVNIPAAAPAPTPTPTQKQDADDVAGRDSNIAALRDEGRELYLERRYQESVVRYTAAVRARTRNITAVPQSGQNDETLALLLGNRAAALMMVGAYDAAAADCCKALDQVPDALGASADRVIPVWDLKAESGPALRSKLLCRMGRALLKAGKVDAAEEVFDATIRTVEGALAKHGRCNLDEKATNVLDQSIADATLNKTDVKRYHNETAEILKYCAGLPPNVAAQRNGAQVLVHVNNALAFSPGDVELHTQKIHLLACMKRWADLAAHCEKFAAECVKLDGVFVDDIENMNPFPSVPPAKNLLADCFDMAALDATTNAPKTLEAAEVGEAVLRMPSAVLPVYLRALRLEERYAEASRASSALDAHTRDTLSASNLVWLGKEKDKLRRTTASKESGDDLFRKGQYEQAAAKYASCLLIDGEGEDTITGADGCNAGGRLHAVLHCNRAACFMALKNYREAAKECTSALQIHSLYMKAMLRRARCHSRLDRHEEAMSEYQRWIYLVEAAVRNPQTAASGESSACYFDRPNDATAVDLEKARKELSDTKKAKVAKAEAEANARARAERQKWYDENLRGGGGAAAGSDAYRRRQQWYDSAGNDGARRWDSFNGSSPKKPGGRSHTYRSPPRASYQQQRSQSHRQQQQQQQARAPSEGNPGGRTHYDVLGVSATSTVADIKKGYRKMALKYHPDKNQDDNAADIFRRVQQAYDTLSDEAARRKYDGELRFGRI